ncbi:MAG TPA: DUF2087 domain-containing protein, partial [Anaeromyxobacter sp.]|nr:DUF2087 domain-containing protein [Anaeromyxobacter sp.]
IVLDARLGPRPELAARAARVLEAASGRLRALPWPGGPDSTAEPHAYLLVDAVITHPAPAAEKVELLADLVAGARDGAPADLVADVLLAHGEAGVAALLRRYRAAPAGALPRPRAILEALARTGTALARAAALDIASEHSFDVERGLAAAEVLGRHLRGEEERPSAAARALEARHAHTVPLSEVDGAALAALREAVGARLEEGEPALREAALRATGALGDRARVGRVRTALDAPRLSIRVAGIRALAALGDAASAERMAGRAAEGEREERLAALEALAVLGPAAFGVAREAVLRLLDDSDPAIQVAAVGALAELGGHELEAILRRLAGVGPVTRRRAAARALHRKPTAPLAPSELSLRVRERLRGPGAVPVATHSVEGAIRFALPELRTYEERELSQRIGRVCEDVSSVRRALVELGLMTRDQAVYCFTPLGEAAWRVERFVDEMRMAAGGAAA